MDVSYDDVTTASQMNIPFDNTDDMQIDVLLDDSSSNAMATSLNATNESQIVSDNQMANSVPSQNQIIQLDAMTNQMDVQFHNPSSQMFIAEEQVFVPSSSQTSASGVLSFGQSVLQKLERGPTKKACVACKKAKCLHLYHCPGSGKRSLCKCVLELRHTAAK